jgi:hypothetical protein
MLKSSKSVVMPKLVLLIMLCVLMVALTSCGNDQRVNNGSGHISGTFVNPDNRGEFISFENMSAETITLLGLSNNYRNARVFQLTYIYSDRDGYRQHFGTFTTSGDTITVTKLTHFLPPFDGGDELTFRIDEANNAVWFGNRQFIGGTKSPGETFPIPSGASPTERSLSLLHLPRSQWVTIEGWNFSIQVPSADIEILELDNFDRLLDLNAISFSERLILMNNGLIITYVTDENIRSLLGSDGDYEVFQFDDGSLGWKVEPDEGAFWFINGNIFFMLDRTADRRNTFFNNTELLHAVVQTLSVRNRNADAEPFFEAFDPPPANVENFPGANQVRQPYEDRVVVPAGWQFDATNGRITAPAGTSGNMYLVRGPAPVTQNDGGVTIEPFLFDDGNVGERIHHRPLTGTEQYFWINGDYRLRATAEHFNANQGVMTAIARSLTSALDSQRPIDTVASENAADTASQSPMEEITVSAGGMSLFIPSTWTYTAFDQGITEIEIFNEDGSIFLFAGYIIAGDPRIFVDENPSQPFQFSDGIVGYMVEEPDIIMWLPVINGFVSCCGIMMIHYGNRAIFENNEDVILGIVRSLRVS